MIGQCPYKQETCPYFDNRPKRHLRRQFGEKTGCYSDVHHVKFPARIYETALELAYRDLPENKQQLCRWEHDTVHLEAKSEKPSLHEMIVALTVKLDDPVPLEEPVEVQN